jgi:hypothetical protein
MSKKAKIILSCAAALLLVVTAFLSLLPQIVRWSIPRVIKAKTGYQAVIESIDLSIIKPSITVTGISLQAKAGEEVMGKVEIISFTGVWGNPFRRQLLSPMLLIIKGVDAQLELLENREGESPNLDFLLDLLLQLQVVTIEAKRLVVATPDGLFKMKEMKGSITPPKDRDRRKNRTLKGSTVLTASGKTGSKSPWQTQGHLSLTGEITPQGNASGIIVVTVNSLKSSYVQANAVVGNIPFSYENHTVKVQEARLDTPTVCIQSDDAQCHPFPLLVEPLHVTLITNKPYALSAQATILSDDLLSLNISLSGKAGQGLAGSFTLTIPELKSVTSHAAFQEKKDVLRYEGISLAGRILLDGQFQIIMDQNVPIVVWQADCRMDTVRADYVLPVGTIGVTLQDIVEVRGRNEAVELSGNVDFTHLKIQSSHISIEGGAGRVRFSGDTDRVEIKETKVFLEKLSFKRKSALTLNKVSLRGSGIVDVSAQDVKNASAILSIDGMGPFTASMASLSPLDAAFEAKGVSLKNALDKVKPVAGFFEGWKVDGSLDLSLRARGNVDLSGAVTLHLATVSDPQDKYLAENLSAKMTISSHLEALTAANRLRANASIERGEALLGRFYLDFGLTPLSIALNVSSTPKGLRINAGTMELAKGGAVRFHSRKNQLFPVEVSLRLEDLNMFFTTFIQSSLAEAYPILNDISAKGKASSDLSLQPENAEGRFRLEGASLTFGSSLNVQDFALDLPWAYSTAERPLPNFGPQRGKITIGFLETERFQMRNQQIGLRFERNKFTLDPVRFSLADGIVLVSDAAIENPFSGKPEISMRIALRDIDLGKLQLLPPPYKLRGILASNALLISGSKKRLDVSGVVTVDLFEGQAVVSDFSMESPLSPFRRLKCNIKFEEVDLEKLTRAFSFGRITGKLNGYIDGLAIANDQADAFTLEVWSVAAKGVPRTVSFNAVEDIQTISSGSEYRSGLPFGLDRFIGDLSYKQIGIKGVLRNDVFKINGTIHKDHKEYLVSRAGFTGINVINMNPDNQISFKDMMERIKRVAEKREAEVK